jgi:hypothetical protein
MMDIQTIETALGIAALVLAMLAAVLLLALVCVWSIVTCVRWLRQLSGVEPNSMDNHPRVGPGLKRW